MAIIFPRVGIRPPVSRLANLRDLGGHPARAGQRVRTGHVYRSDSLTRADHADWVVLEGLGVDAIVDLRTPGESAAAPVTGVRGDLLRFHLPVLHRTWLEVGLVPTDDAVAFLAARYISMAEEGADAFAGLLRVCADRVASTTVVFSSLGKDRAGVAAAVLLGVLGVPDEVIVHDYTVSDAATPHAPLAYREAPAEAMVALLAYLRARYGSVVGYARSIGVEVEALDELHSGLLS